MRRLLPAPVSLVIAALLLAGCAPVPPAPGTTTEQLLTAWGKPTGRYALPDGATRIEYATGPYGRTTWMVDVDAGGRVTSSRQVLNEAEFLQVQSASGLTREGLLLWLGRPGERQHGGLIGGETWSWRYPTNECLWFRVSVSDAGLVTSASYGIDPRCDAPSPRR